MTDLERGQWLRAIVELEWLGLDAVVAENRADYLLDVVFRTASELVRLTATDQYLVDETEAFNLEIGPIPENGRWQEGSGPNLLSFRSIHKELAEGSMAHILTPPRTVRFFTDPRFAQRVAPSGESLLRNCAAVEFSKVTNGMTSQLVLLASNNFPCEIEIGMTAESCSSLLAGLVPFEVL